MSRRVLSLRERVERMLPEWDRWYPNLFAAAEDLGVIQARVCDPSSLLLSSRHSQVRRAAENAHREKWGGSEEDGGKRGKRRRRRNGPRR